MVLTGLQGRPTSLAVALPLIQPSALRLSLTQVLAASMGETDDVLFLLLERGAAQTAWRLGQGEGEGAG